MTIVSRIVSVSLENFRGFRDSHELNTDADLVLVTGANGYGKTSLMDALLLLLTGWHAYDYPKTEKLVALRGDSDTADSLCEFFELRAEIQLAEEDDKQASKMLALKCNRQGEVLQGGSNNKPLCPVALPPSRLNSVELAARLCGFFQDRVDSLFDETTRGTTLRDVFEPLPTWLSMVADYLYVAKDQSESPDRNGEVQRRLSEKLEALEKAREQERNERQAALAEQSREQLEEAMGEAFKTFAPLYKQLIGGLPDWPPPPTEVSNATLTRFAMEVIRDKPLTKPPEDRKETDQALPNNLRRALLDREFGELHLRLRAARRQAGRATARTTEIQQQLDRVNGELEQIDREYPGLGNELRIFSAADPELPDAEAVFRTLAENAARWARVSVASAGPDAERFARVVEELAAVDPQEAGKCVQALEAWLTPRRAALARKQTLEPERDRLERELQESRESEEVQRLRKLEAAMSTALDELIRPWSEERRHLDWECGESSRQAAREYLESAMKAVKAMSDAITSVTAPDKALMAQLREMANQVMSRFSLVEGVRPLQLVVDPKENDAGENDYSQRRSYVIKTGDGRALYHLSTGQRVQTAISMLAAQNQAVSHLLAHRILLLDDVTTAYDLSNLTREAILWRQLAYGCEGENHRQVFISSHHEDLTNHLLDLLVPPLGRSLRLIRLTGWSPKHGPSYKQFEVTPTQASDRDSPARHAFIEDLEKSSW